MARRRKLRNLYPDRRGYLLRTTAPTPSEKRRHRNSISLRVGEDLVLWIRETAADLGVTQGVLGRALVLAGRQALENGVLDLPENGAEPTGLAKND